MTLSSLPEEVVRRIFSYVPPNVLFDGFIGEIPPLFSRKLPLEITDNLHLVYLAFCQVFSGLVVLIGGIHTRKQDPIALFHSNLQWCFTVDSFARGYHMVRDLVMYNMRAEQPVLPKELGLYYQSSGDEEDEAAEAELLALVKLLELLAVDYAPTTINVQLVHTGDPTETIKTWRRKVTSRMLVLDSRLRKVLFLREFAAAPFYDHLQFMSSRFSNLHEAYLWNDGMRNSSLPRSPHVFPTIEKLDLSGNFLASLARVPVSDSLTFLRVRANGLTSLAGLEFRACPSLTTLDVSVNAITSLSGAFLPPTLRHLDLSFNAIAEIGPVVLPEGLETLKLSRNNISSLVHLRLPKALRTLQLDCNNITALPGDLFTQTGQLTDLNLAENDIDDLDELGNLPNTLKHLKLDGNQIDHPNFANILMPNLQTLSMAETGLVWLANLTFPHSITEVNISRNELCELNSIKFGPNLTKLDLRSNLLLKFDPERQRIQIPHLAKVLLGNSTKSDGG